MRLPPEYVAFLIEANGGSGPLGDDGWVTFNSVEDLLEVNRSYHSEEFEQFEDLVLFGNGGGEAFCFQRDGTVIVAA